MGFVINVGEVVNARMMTRPLMTCPLSLQTGLLLSFGVMMSCQVGGRWGSSTGVNGFVFAGFGIPFGLTFIVLCQGCELITANYMFCTFACLAAKPEDRAAEIKATLINWVVCWTFNLVGAVLHFVIFAWQTGLIMTVAIDNDNYADGGGALEHNNKLFYKNSADFIALGVHGEGLLNVLFGGRQSMVFVVGAAGHNIQRSMIDLIQSARRISIRSRRHLRGSA